MRPVQQLGHRVEDGGDVKHLDLGGADGARQHADTEDERDQRPCGDKVP
jgi:hypothetical protein